MTKPLEHKHLIVRAEIQNPPKDRNEIEKWLVEFIADIGMNIAIGPFSYYSTMEGNVGMTAGAIIETSHIILHVFEDYQPFPVLEFDAYSCSTLDPLEVLRHMEKFKPVTTSYMFLDREFDLVVTDKGDIRH